MDRAGVPRAEGAAVAQDSRNTKARGRVVALGGMLSTAWDAGLTLVNAQRYPILEPGKLLQTEINLLKLESKRRAGRASGRVTKTNPRARLQLLLA